MDVTNEHEKRRYFIVLGEVSSPIVDEHIISSSALSSLQTRFQDNGYHWDESDHVLKTLTASQRGLNESSGTESDADHPIGYKYANHNFRGKAWTKPLEKETQTQDDTLTVLNYMYFDSDYAMTDKHVKDTPELSKWASEYEKEMKSSNLDFYESLSSIKIQDSSSFELQRSKSKRSIRKSKKFIYH